MEDDLFGRIDELLRQAPPRDMVMLAGVDGLSLAAWGPAPVVLCPGCAGEAWEPALDESRSVPQAGGWRCLLCGWHIPQ